MKARRDRLLRAAALTDQLRRLEAMRVAQIESALNETKRSEKAALDILEQGVIAPSLPIAQMQFFAARGAQLEEDLRLQQARAQEQGRRARQTGKLLARAEESLRIETKRDELRQISDIAADASDVSVP